MRRRPVTAPAPPRAGALRGARTAGCRARRLAGAALLAVAVTGTGFAQESVDVEVSGVEGELKENVLRALSLEVRRREADLSARRVRVLHARAPDEIRAALEPFGYYRVAIEASLEQTTDGWRARYQIDPGPILRVAHVDFELSGPGAEDPELREVGARFAPRPGDALVHAVYEDAKRDALRRVVDRGYLDAQYTRRAVRVNRAAYAATIAMQLATGPRYRFGALQILQDPPVYDPDFLARYVTILPGDPFSGSALLALQGDLNGSDFFTTVEIEPRRADAVERTIPVDVRLVPRPPNRYTLGVGYSTDTGPRLRLGWERWHITDTGHSLATDLRASPVVNALNVSYRIPVGDPRTDRVTLGANATTERTDTVDSDVYKLTASYSHARGHWRETPSLTWQHEVSTVAAETARTTLVVPGVGWSRVWAEDRIFTRLGANLNVDLRASDEALGSDTTFGQALVRAKAIVPLWASGRVLLRGDVGTSVVGEFSELPASMRFFAGGDQSVRGYGYKTLGPTDDTGAVIGGERLLVGSIELEQGLTGNWAAALFQDAGNALDDFADPLKRGAGVGLRWRSPVGQIRLDVAWAVSEPDRPWRLHLSIGPDL